MKKKLFSRGNWSGLLYNNKFSLVFSVLLAVVLWAVLTSNDTQEHARAITGVPIRMEVAGSTSEDALKIFTKVSSTATVYVKGNSMIVNQMKSSDFEVVGTLPTSATTPGSYNLQLRAQYVGQTLSTNQYTVDSVSPAQILVSADRQRERTFKIQGNITYKDGYQSDPAYFVGTPTLSTDTVTISGPEKQVYQINRVVYEYVVSNTLTESKKFTADLVMYDSNGNRIEKGDMTVSPEQVDVTIPVLPRLTATLAATFTNKPSGLSLTSGRVSVLPSSIEIAGPKDTISALNGQISLDPIDFTTISPSHNTFDVNITLPTNCKNLSDMPTARVKLNLSDMTTRQMTATTFTVKNLASGKSAAVSASGVSVVVVGPADDVAKLTEANVVGSADLSGKENFTGQTEVPVTFTITGSTTCWVYGSYMANVNITNQ